MGSPRVRDKQDISLPAEYVGKRRIVKYDPGVALEVLERVAEGETLEEILADEGMPSRMAFHQWRMLYPALQSAYETAKRISAEALEEEALGQARFLSGPADYTGTKVSGLKASMEQLRWSAQRRDPASFGQDTLKQALVVPIQINTSLDLGPQGTSTGSSDIYQFTVDVEAGEGAAFEPTDDRETIEEAVLGAKSSVVATDMLGKKPPGRPKGSRKGHKKSPASVKKTIANYENAAARRAAKESPDEPIS